MMKLLFLIVLFAISCASQTAPVDAKRTVQNSEIVISCEKKDADFVTLIEIDIPNEFSHTWKFYYRNATSIQEIQQHESDGALFNKNNADGFGAGMAVVSMSSRITGNGIEIQFKYSRPEEDNREYLQILKEGATPVKSKYFIEKKIVVPFAELPEKINDTNMQMRIRIEEI